MRVTYTPRISPNARVAMARAHQKGGTLPGVMYGTGSFGNLPSGLKKVAVPALKAIGKAALPMAQEALVAGMGTVGSMKQRLKAAAQTATQKNILIALTKAEASGAMTRPF